MGDMSTFSNFLCCRFQRHLKRSVEGDTFEFILDLKKKNISIRINDGAVIDATKGDTVMTGPNRKYKLAIRVKERNTFIILVEYEEHSLDSK